MILEQFTVGVVQTNCYLLGDPKTGQAVVIDPGGSSSKIARRINELGLNLSAVLNTHAHFDHILEAWSLKESCGGEIYLHAKEIPLLDDPVVGLNAAGSFATFPRKKIDRELAEGDVLRFGSIELDVLPTPGHSPGHVSFHYKKEGIIFVGDTLFAGSIGRTDFIGGSYEQLLRSVREKIFPLALNTVVYPGHGPATEVGRERLTNPFFR
ncbi:MAG: MBL fold metallo-hydrolase [Syntrophobacteraceae bacterium]